MSWSSSHQLCRMTIEVQVTEPDMTPMDPPAVCTFGPDFGCRMFSNRIRWVAGGTLLTVGIILSAVLISLDDDCFRECEDNVAADGRMMEGCSSGTHRRRGCESRLRPARPLVINHMPILCVFCKYCYVRCVVAQAVAGRADWTSQRSQTQSLSRRFSSPALQPCQHVPKGSKCYHV